MNVEKRKCKVVCLVESLAPGGAERQMVNLAILLKNSGYDLSLVYYYDNNFYSPLLNDAGVRHYCIGKDVCRIKRIFEIRRFVKAASPDVIISYMNTPSMISCLLRLFDGGFKLIVSERNTVVKNDIRQRVKFLLYAFADTIVANSYSQSSFISKRYRRLEHKLCVITNCVSKVFSQNRVKRLYADELTKIIVVGRVVPQKNVLLFLKAIALLNEEGRLMKVRWIGPTPDKTYYEKVMTARCELHLQNVVSFDSVEENVVKCYNEADVLCLPSLFEGTPNVVCEAMSCGVPIVCGDVCDNSLLVKDGGNGFLFDPTDVESIACAIRKFMNLSAEEKISMSNRSAELSEDLFSEERMKESYENLINKVLS